MKRALNVIVAAAALVAGLLLGPGGAAGRPPAASDPTVPAEQHDMGVGERLVLVVGGVFPTPEEAEQANASITIGELQGYYVAPVGQFSGLDGVLGADPDDYTLLSAFRTREGAEEFLSVVRAAGAAGFVTSRLENRGGVYVGLGQEQAPDGSGPLHGPIPGVTT